MTHKQAHKHIYNWKDINKTLTIFIFECYDLGDFFFGFSVLSFVSVLRVYYLYDKNVEGKQKTQYSPTNLSLLFSIPHYFSRHPILYH